MANYNSDRSFTDFIHNNLAIDLIYKQLRWNVQNVNNSMLENVDMRNAVDYFCIDENHNKLITVQERFREVKYQNYNDFTIRYERKHNPHEERQLSEFFKLNVDYFIYGIINSTKIDVAKATDFIKYAVIDIIKLKQLFATGDIIIDDDLQSYTCNMINNKMHCPVNENKDRSSSFIPIDIKMLCKLCPESIILQKGFHN